VCVLFTALISAGAEGGCVSACREAAVTGDARNIPMMQINVKFRHNFSNFMIYPPDVYNLNGNNIHLLQDKSFSEMSQEQMFDSAARNWSNKEKNKALQQNLRREFWWNIREMVEKL